MSNSMTSSAVPLEIEEDATLGLEVDAAAVWRGNGPLKFPRHFAALGPHVLLAIPMEQALGPPLPALHHQGDKELVGLQIVRGVPAVVADSMAALDIRALIVAVPVGEHPGSPVSVRAHVVYEGAPAA